MVEIPTNPTNIAHPPARAAREAAIEIDALQVPSLKERLVSRLGTDRKALVRRSMVDFKDKSVFLRAQAHLGSSCNQSQVIKAPRTVWIALSADQYQQVGGAIPCRPHYHNPGPGPHTPNLPTSHALAPMSVIAL